MRGIYILNLKPVNTDLSVRAECRYLSAGFQPEGLGLRDE